MTTEKRPVAFATSLVTREDALDLVRLFDACGSACHCRYWHFDGDKNDWLERCATRPDLNRSELEEGLRRGTPDATGVVARSTTHPEANVVGWVKLARADVTPKLFEQRYYRGLPCMQVRSPDLFVIGCLLVHPDWRRAGVAHALVEGAIDVARSLGATALLALPRATTEPVSDAELWLGPLSVFASLGFREVHSERPYPVLRLDLQPAGVRA